MSRISKKAIAQDKARQGGHSDGVIKKLILPSPQLAYLATFRKAQYGSFLERQWARFRLARLSRKTGIQIPYGTKIGKGLYLGHFGSFIVNPKSIIGDNCNIQARAVIGQENRGSRKGAPTIGNEVWIGSNAVIVGNITIGDDVLIAPNSYVNFDVPSHSIVIGNPATIHPRNHATDGYINRKV